MAACHFSSSPTIFIVSVLVASLEYVLPCRDCGVTLKREIDDFYDFPPPSSSSESVGPCHDRDNSIAKAKRPVFSHESWVSEQSSCPWEDHYDEDMFGIRYPCRIHSARLTVRSSEPQRCLRHPGLLARRTSNKFCEPLLQNVPVMVKIGCQRGCHLYERRNVTVAVGFTCAFRPL